MSTIKNLKTLTINRLPLDKYKILAKGNNVNPEQIYELSNLDELLTEKEITTLITKITLEHTSGLIKSVKWADIADAPNMTNYAIINKVEELVNALIDGAPETLDTIKEIANALNNDPNLGKTLLNKIATKVDKIVYEQEMSGKADKQALDEKASIQLKIWEE